MTSANSARARGSASAAAATLPISSRAVTSGSSSASVGASSRGQAAGGRLGGDHSFGHDQLGQPAPQLPALAGAAGRQRGAPRSAAQSRFARVDLIDRTPG